ncbi:hypothetical protein LJC23_03405 [Desulfovibrio sp. OttesenSCG-928-I05]|nr:hypothetical protein [Desulfovibrio sp. OttesenSCG-928-I05]
MIRFPESGAALRGVTILLFCLLACTPFSGAHAGDVQRLFIGVTPELSASGMMRHIADRFEEDRGVKLSWQVLTPDELFSQYSSCFVDAIIADIPEREHTFVGSGFGQGWYALFHSRLLLVGPRGNPGAVPGSSLLEAMQTIEAARLPFVAEDTLSGARDAELFIWSRLQRPANLPVDLHGDLHTKGVAPVNGDWYFLTSPEEGALPTAAAKRAYTLVTCWEWTVFAERLAQEGKENPLDVVVDSDILVNNQYNFIILSQEYCPLVHLEAARTFAEWSMEPETQSYFAAFRNNGKKIFHAMDPSIDMNTP